MTRGADIKCSVHQFCNYLKTTLKHFSLNSVASISTSKNSSSAPVLKADSGASKNFIREQDEKETVKVTTLTNGPAAKLSNYLRQGVPKLELSWRDYD